jgi:GDSL-like Lipase/Acylhydrolase family
MMRRNIVMLYFLLLCSAQWSVVLSQDTARSAPTLRFLDQIEAYVRQDSAAPPAKGTILFIGSSIFRQWTHLQEHMAPLPVYNRAFGGSRTAEILLHMDDLVFPYAPRIIVYYCGSNDVNANVPTADIANNFTLFVEKVHSRLPGTKVVYVSINRAPQKIVKWTVVDSVNALVRDVCERSPALTYIDVNPALFDSTGAPRIALYKDDKLHFKTDEAYLGFTAIIKPILTKLWNAAAQ